MNKLRFSLFFLFFLRAIHAEESFEEAMGKNTPCWKYVQTKEDKDILAFYKQAYEQNIFRLHLSKKDTKIPKIMHFIWLGSKKIPTSAKNNIRSWIKKHPSWVFKLWVDCKRASFDPKLKIAFLEKKILGNLKNCFFDTNNNVEKEDIARLMILFNEGGAYVEHDVKCLANIDSLHSSYDFYASLSLPHDPILSSSISISNAILAAKPFHPILQQAILDVQNRWSLVGKQFPGTDEESALYRTLYRSYYSLNQAMWKNLQKEDIVLPANYFHSIGKKQGKLANHLQQKPWLQLPVTERDKVDINLDALSQKMQKTLFFNNILFGIVLAYVGLLFYLSFFKKRKST